MQNNNLYDRSRAEYKIPYDEQQAEIETQTQIQTESNVDIYNQMASSRKVKFNDFVQKQIIPNHNKIDENMQQYTQESQFQSQPKLKHSLSQYDLVNLEKTSTNNDFIGNLMQHIPFANDSNENNMDFEPDIDDIDIENDYEDISDYIFENNKELPNIEIIKYVYNEFMNRHPHMNNPKAKQIIFELCKIAIESMPQHLDDIHFYINFLESSITQEFKQSQRNLNKYSFDYDDN